MVTSHTHCSALEVEIKQLRIKFEAWQGLLHSVNTATDTNFSLKHDGGYQSMLGDDAQMGRDALQLVKGKRTRF